MASDDSFQNRRLPGAFPTWPEIRDRVERFVEENREIARIETIGRSAEGRKICAVFVTDNAQSARKKEIVLIVMGRHGDELGTRTVGLRLLEWLSSPQASDILVHQQIVQHLPGFHKVAFQGLVDHVLDVLGLCRGS